MTWMTLWMLLFIRGGPDYVPLCHGHERTEEGLSSRGSDPLLKIKINKKERKIK